ncbi:hypothetical protein SARC_03426 [Sphaeroforma arctica JP610]|uniref:Uncharacterized protein n=1 Tax=Sphaeroforma arctica JP610 TaxID=667725 RepID=A0A0L0G660_9EUKA|nr:hypothetical protein SARC_03426 [Sphaeroforma arctica JP610]KNC84346.1 hypothetical protein SARC_03426 [Sphaeroforma arctica JP610]|eukprot:XP_014158248.1 hypothetical protein SARC_03426 [Sphaeroforma arctica JP610]
MTDYFAKADTPSPSIVTPDRADKNASMYKSRQTCISGSHIHKSKVSTALKASQKRAPVNFICIDDDNSNDNNNDQKENLCPSTLKENNVTPVLMEGTATRHSPRLKANNPTRTPVAGVDTQAKGTSSLKVPRCRTRTAISTESPTPTAARSLSYSVALNTSTPATGKDNALDTHDMERRSVSTSKSTQQQEGLRTRYGLSRTSMYATPSEFVPPAQVGRRSTRAVKRSKKCVDNSEKEFVDVDAGVEVAPEESSVPITDTVEKSQDISLGDTQLEGELKLEESLDIANTRARLRTRNTSRTRQCKRSRSNNKVQSNAENADKGANGSSSAVTSEGVDKESSAKSAMKGVVSDCEDESTGGNVKGRTIEGTDGKTLYDQAARPERVTANISSSTSEVSPKSSQAKQGVNNKLSSTKTKGDNKGTLAKEMARKSASMGALLNLVEPDELVGDLIDSAEDSAMLNASVNGESVAESDYVSADERLSDALGDHSSTDVSVLSAFDETVISDKIEMTNIADDAEGVEKDSVLQVSKKRMRTTSSTQVDDLAQKESVAYINESQAESGSKGVESGIHSPIPTARSHTTVQSIVEEHTHSNPTPVAQPVPAPDIMNIDSTESDPTLSKKADPKTGTDDSTTVASDSMAAAMLSLSRLADLEVAHATESDNSEDDSDDDFLNVSLSKPSYLSKEELERMGMGSDNPDVSTGTSTTGDGGLSVSGAGAYTTGRRTLRSRDHPQIKPLTNRAPLSNAHDKRAKRKSRISIDHLLEAQKWRRNATMADFNVDETSRTSFNFDEFAEQVDNEDQATNTAAVYETLGQNSGKDATTNTVIKQALDMNAGALEDREWEGESFFPQSPSPQYGVPPELKLLEDHVNSPIINFLSICKDWESIGIVLSAYDFRSQCGRMDTLSCVYLARWLVGVVARATDGVIAACGTQAVCEVLVTFKDNLAGKLSILTLVRECFAVFGMGTTSTPSTVQDKEPGEGSANEADGRVSKSDFPISNFKHFMEVLSAILSQRDTAISSSDSLDILKLLLRASMDRKTHPVLPELVACLHKLLVMFPDKETEIVNTMRAVTTSSDASIFICTLIPWSPFERRIRAKYALSHSLRYFRICRAASRVPQSGDIAEETNIDMEKVSEGAADSPKYDKVSLQEVVLALEKVRITPTTDYRMLYHAVYHLSLALDHSQISESDQRIISLQAKRLPGKIKDMQGKYPLRTKIKDVLILLEIWIGQWRTPTIPGHKNKKQKTLMQLFES